jgi:hypothetical protein
MGQDAARAQGKMDSAILSKRIIKVDFAHQEKPNFVLKSRKPAKDAVQVTTLSMLKGTQHARYFFGYQSSSSLLIVFGLQKHAGANCAGRSQVA